MNHFLTIESAKLTPEQEIVAEQNKQDFKLILKTEPDENGLSVTSEGFQVENGVIFRATYVTPLKEFTVYGFSEGVSLERK